MAKTKVSELLERLGCHEPSVKAFTRIMLQNGPSMTESPLDAVAGSIMMIASFLATAKLEDAKNGTREYDQFRAIVDALPEFEADAAFFHASRRANAS